MVEQVRALNPRRSAGGCAACTGTAGAHPNAAGLYAVQAEVSACTAQDSVLNSERVKAKPFGRLRGLDQNTTEARHPS